MIGNIILDILIVVGALITIVLPIILVIGLTLFDDYDRLNWRGYLLFFGGLVGYGFIHWLIWH